MHADIKQDNPVESTPNYANVNDVTLNNSYVIINLMSKLSLINKIINLINQHYVSIIYFNCINCCRRASMAC